MVKGRKNIQDRAREKIGTILKNGYSYLLEDDISNEIKRICKAAKKEILGELT